MLKIPSFILGGILILTGLVSYLVQDPSLSIKLSGPWASDAEFVLSDGDQEVMLDFMPWMNLQVKMFGGLCTSSTKGTPKV